MKLMKKLDYEARSAFIIQIVAEVKYFVIMFLIQFSKLVSLKTSLIKFFSTQNAWTDNAIDTRNVGVHEVVIEVEDLPDTPPYFLIAPPVTKLPETATIVSSLT